MGDIRRPKLIRPINNQVAQQIRIDLVRLISFTQVSTWL
ncbi:MAG: hypothetical protein ACJAZF_004907 [Granulosicoccus sp.]